MLLPLNCYWSLRIYSKVVLLKAFLWSIILNCYWYLRIHSKVILFKGFFFFFLSYFLLNCCWNLRIHLELILFLMFLCVTFLLVMFPLKTHLNRIILAFYINKKKYLNNILGKKKWFLEELFGKWLSNNHFKWFYNFFF